MAGIFNRAIFNDAIFNTEPVVDAAQYSGGYVHAGRRRDDGERQAAIRRIEALIRGPDGAETAKVIARVAADIAEEPVPDRSEALIAALEREALEYRAEYVAILQREIERVREDDDEIALLMLLH